jgi:hypothetical protein
VLSKAGVDVGVFAMPIMPLINDTPRSLRGVVVRAKAAPKYLHSFDHFLVDETLAYARYTQEILRGEWLGASLDTYQPYLAAGSAAGSGWYRDRLGPGVLALLAAAFGASVPAAFIAADFLFPALAAFCLLLLSRHFFSSLAGGVAAASLVLWFNWLDLVSLRDLVWGAPQFGSIFLRTPYPQLSTPIFVLFLLALVGLRRRATIGRAALVAGALALNFYTYVYSWSFALAVMAAWLILLAIPQTAGQSAGGQSRGRLAALAAGSTLAAVVAAAPVWSPLLAPSQAIFDSFRRVGGDFTHRPELTIAPLCAAALGLAVVATFRGWSSGWFWMTYWLAAVAATNQQVLTGRVMQPFHYFIYYIEPFAMLYLCDLAAWVSSRRPAARLAPALAVAAVAAGVAVSLWRHDRDLRLNGFLHTADAPFRELVAFLGQPSLGQFAFLTNDPFLDTVLPAYVRQKPLRPWIMDPLSNRELEALETTAFPLDRSKILLVLNAHRGAASVEPCQILLSNRDFRVARAAPCTGQ